MPPTPPTSPPTSVSVTAPASPAPARLQATEIKPHDDLSDWRFEGTATRGTFTIAFRGEDVGKPVLVVAHWCNAKGQTGPLSQVAYGTVAA